METRMFLCLHIKNLHATLIGRAVTRSQTSLGVRAKFRLGFRAGYDVFQMYAVLISTNQIRALKSLRDRSKNMRVSMYFLHLELTFTPHYIITDKGLL